MKNLFWLLTASFTLLLSSAAEWSQFRGPGASGVDDAVQLPVKWNMETGEKVGWKTPIPGLAHSSPVVWGDRVYLATVTSKGKADLKVGLYGDIDSADDNGEQVWRILALDKVS